MGTLVDEGHELEGYRVVGHLSRKATSEICIAQDLTTRQLWLIKHVLCNSEKDRHIAEHLINEYEIGIRLTHHNIRRVVRLIKHRRLMRLAEVSLILEFFDTPTLEEQPPATLAEAADIFHQVACALDHMHERGFVHNGIKPCTIFVDERNLVRIIDLSKACEIGTTKQRIQGTPGYLAPEQAFRRPLTPKTDIYNLGATMYAVLVGEVIPTMISARSGNRSKSLYRGVIEEDWLELPPSPQARNAAIHPVLSQLVMDCIQPRPEDRPESMRVVAKRLDVIGDLLRLPPVDAETLASVLDDEDD